MANVPLSMVALFVFLLLPFRLRAQHLKKLAFALWLIGGMVMSIKGSFRMVHSQTFKSMGLFSQMFFTFLGLLIGFVKGKFIFSKVSFRNIKRLDEMETPHRLVYVYSLRSWLLIGAMMTLGISLNLGWIRLPIYVRGMIGIVIGTGLLISSFAYVRSFKTLS